MSGKVVPVVLALLAGAGIGGAQTIFHQRSRMWGRPLPTARISTITFRQDGQNTARVHGLRIETRDLSISADQAELNFQTGEATLEGPVRIHFAEAPPR